MEPPPMAGALLSIHDKGRLAIHPPRSEIAMARRDDDRLHDVQS